MKKLLILAGIALSIAGSAMQAAVVIAVGDRPYYTHGPQYWVGRRHYVWVPGHWSVRYGHRYWRHGYYVIR